MSDKGNYHNGRFQNLIPTRVYREGTNYLRLFYAYLKASKYSAPQQALLFAREDLTTAPRQNVEIVWFGHSSYLLYVNGLRVLVDPVFINTLKIAPFVGVNGYKGTAIYTTEDLPAIDLVIITHDHQDHMDFATIRRLGAKGCHFCVPSGVGSYLRQLQIPAGKINELDWWDNIKFNDSIVLTATPARHFSGRGLLMNKTLWASYILNIGQYRIFIGGDSGYGPHFKTICDRCGPVDLAVLECGQYGDLWPDIHMTPEQTVLAAKDLSATMLMPVHWGRFPLSLHHWLEPALRVRAAAEKANLPLFLPQIGKRTSAYPGEAAFPWWEQQAANC